MLIAPEIGTIVNTHGSLQVAYYCLFHAYLAKEVTTGRMVLSL